MEPGTSTPLYSLPLLYPADSFKDLIKMLIIFIQLCFCFSSFHCAPPLSPGHIVFILTIINRNLDFLIRILFPDKPGLLKITQTLLQEFVALAKVTNLLFGFSCESLFCFGHKKGKNRLKRTKMKFSPQRPLIQRLNNS